MTSNPAEPRYRGLYTAAAVSAIAMLAIMIAQIVIYVIWPPPQTAEAAFALLRQNPLLGLLSLDLLYLLNNALLILIYLGLWAALRRTSESAVLVALVLGLVGIAAYYASGAAFEMLALSKLHAAAGEVQQAAYLAAGEALMAGYKGTAFNVYYVLNAVSLLIFAAVMLRSTDFSKAAASFGLAAGVLMVVPSSAGAVGMVFALASLVPWAVFLVLLIPHWLRMGRG